MNNKKAKDFEEAFEQAHREAEDSLNDDGSCIDYDDLHGDEDDDFEECPDCDGHDACRDFGCAYDLGLGKMVKKKDWG